ncbi:MAG: FAD-dependent oxidoreductase [Gammaproteobacteria bacterium]
MELNHVLSPFRIADLELRNRVVRTAYGTNLGRGGITEDLIAHHEARARGGVGLSILEATGVHPSGPMTLNAWDDAVISGYRELTGRLHRHGMAVFSQLNHLGMEQGARGGRPWSASALTSPSTGLRAVPVNETQIGELIAGFAAAARRAREGGLDGVEIHCAHGHLLQQFLSSLTNQREDGWGGDWQGRARLTLETVRACREAVGGDFVLGIRVGPQVIDRGIGVEDCLRLLRDLERENLVDYISVSHGSIYNPDKIIGAMHEPAGYELEHSARITAAASVPTIVTGRLRTLAEAEEVLEKGIADLIGLTRAHIADPDLIAKTVAGRASEVRPCIGCNQGCVGGLAKGRLACTVNAEAGHETESMESMGSVSFVPATNHAISGQRETMGSESFDPAMSHAISNQWGSKDSDPIVSIVPRHVVVVGGGPAGMEAARVAAVRGHCVTLLEAGPVLGGALQAARRAPHHEAIGDIADWLQQELQRLQVNIRFDCRADVEVIAELKPDHVILACGAAEGSIQQSHQPGLLLSGNKTVELVPVRRLLSDEMDMTGIENAVVLDETGGYEAIAAAEWLVERNVNVVWATGYRAFAPRMETALVSRPALGRLREAGMHLFTRAALLAVNDSNCTLGWLDGAASWQQPVDLIVAAVPGLPADSLAATLRGAGFEVSVAGDARRPGDLQAAIRDGYHAGLAV